MAVQRRKRMMPKQSKKLFSKTAERVHPRNAPDTVMRGGIRL